MSFVGGGTDVEPFLSMHGSEVVAASIDKYVTTLIEPNSNHGLELISIDTNQKKFYSGSEPDHVLSENLLSACLTAIPKESRKGFRISVNSPVPPKSGLGASSAIILSVLGALHKYFSIELTKNETSYLAYKIEREILRIPGGCQDQYACANGGINEFQFKNAKDVKIIPLNVEVKSRNAIESNIFLVWTGISRNSNEVLEDQISLAEKGQNTSALMSQKDLIVNMRKSLIDSNLHLMGETLLQAWDLKRNFTKLVSSQKIDEIFRIGMDNGALGGKLLGAGGGGFFFFVSESGERESIISEFRKKNYEIFKPCFENLGLHYEYPK